ncbi:MAG: VC0807 family protein [Verrucomicrobiota bacterium]|nr:VC0807 family protein [Verrucomicrobiota bacterium]
MDKHQPISSIDRENSKDSKIKKPKENMLLNLGFNLFLPIIILNKGKKWFGSYLETYFESAAVVILIVALAFPIAYFIYDYYKRTKYNFISIIGLVSVLLTGGIGILNIPTEWFAIKEALIPSLIGLAIIISLKTPYPLIRTLLYSPEIMNVDKVQHALSSSQNTVAFEKLLQRCTYLLASSFLLSAILNYLLARYIVVSASGTDAFNAEVSRMMFWSWPVIVIPSMVIMFITLWILLRGIYNMTGLKLEDVMHGADSSKSKNN